MTHNAFISHSHADTATARWLDRAIETYRVPRRLARDVPAGAPRRLFPVFRDRDELPTSSDLAHSIRQTLSDSRFLIVIRSPSSARSRWVNVEVRASRQMGRADRVLCVIIAGEPNASDKPTGAGAECFARRFATPSVRRALACFRALARPTAPVARGSLLKFLRWYFADPSTRPAFPGAPNWPRSATP